MLVLYILSVAAIFWIICVIFLRFLANMAYDGYGKRQRMDGNSYGMPPSKRVCEADLKL